MSEHVGADQTLNRRRALRLVGGTAVAAGAAAIALPKPGAAVAQASPSMVGTWSVNVRRPDGSLVAGWLVFSSDGTIVRTNTGHLTQGPGMGVWVQDGSNTAVWTINSFTFDANGQPTGQLKTRARATLSEDGESYSAVFDLDTLDLEGNLVRTATGGRADGTRVHVEPPAS